MNIIDHLVIVLQATGLIAIGYGMALSFVRQYQEASKRLAKIPVRIKKD
jgi:hypothetical protein